MAKNIFTWNACLTMFLLKDYLCLRKPVLNTLIRIKNGYNSTPGGDGTGKEVTEEFRQKMSKIHKGKTPWNKGVPMPEYIKEKLLAAHVGKKHSEETRRKMSEARKGRKPFLGRKHSAETRLKMSRSQNERFNNERRYV